ncbi:MAG: hypothetical protein RI994_926, partial [Pseudomonadota bacterium]
LIDPNINQKKMGWLGAYPAKGTGLSKLVCESYQESHRQ